jgi:pimeloyl-ACP methyl ester carboxylesterase
MRGLERRWLAVACVAVVLWGAACGSSAGSKAGSVDTTLPPPKPDQTAPAQTVYATAAGSVTLACEGTGTVPVILLAGLIDPITTWDDLVQRLGPDVLTCRYDPIVPGPPTAPITPSSRANGLAEALSSSGLTGPYVLVGHSLAGFTVRQFGADHPEMVRAALLLDPTTPDAVDSLASSLQALTWDPEATKAEMNAPVTWPHVPVVVLSHDPALLTLYTPEIEHNWTVGQQGYAALSPQGRQEAVTGSGHYIYREAPDQVVTTLRQLLAS